MHHASAVAWHTCFLAHRAAVAGGVDALIAGLRVRRIQPPSPPEPHELHATSSKSHAFRSYGHDRDSNSNSDLDTSIAP
jgi:hypothetical protein